MMMPATMAVSTITVFSLAVAASELQSEFGVSKFQLGALAAINTGVGALLAPMSGRFVDRVGARPAIATTLAFAFASASSAALAPSFAVLLIASSIGGIAQGLGNPATNSAILAGFDETRRGLVVGAKQSGVQAAIIVVGVAVPLMSARFGWRSAVWLNAGIAVFVAFGLCLIPTRSEQRTVHSDRTARLSPFVTRVAIYGFLLGLTGGGFNQFLALFAHEEVNLTVEQAGWIFALQGIVALPSRLAAGAILDRGISVRKMMASMAFLGGLALLIIAASSGGTASLLLSGTILAGLSLGTWTAAANLAVIQQGEQSGRATGRLIFGFLLGLTLGGPLVGWTIDQFTYGTAWIASSVLAILAGFVILGRSSTSNPKPDHSTRASIAT